MTGNSFIDNDDLVGLLWSWKSRLLGLALLGGLLGAVFSAPYFIPPLYSSSAVVYPINLQSFSEESPTKQMLQFFDSDDLKLRLAKDFDLYQATRLDSGDPGARRELGRYLAQNLRIEPTEYLSVEVWVRDGSAARARAMVDSVLSYFNQQLEQFRRSQLRQMVEQSRVQMLARRAELDSLQKLHDQLRVENGLLNYDIQVERLTEGYANLLSSGAPAARVEQLEKQVLELRAKGGQFLEVDARMRSLLGLWLEAKASHDKNMAELNRQVKFYQVVSSPSLNPLKVYPTRWLLSVLGAFCGLAFGVLLVLWMERKRWKQA